MRRECRVFRGTCGFYPCAFYIAQGAAGAAGTRRSLRPLFWAKIRCTARAHRVASAKSYVDLTSYVDAAKRPRLRHSGAMPTGPRKARPDDRLRIEPGISGLVLRTIPE
jgi:hypothetical protein